MLKPILTDTGDFPKMRRKGGIYVDKTAYFHRLITGGNDCFFIARPRRFGKSLMISTLKAIFEGRKELFEGLDISKTDWKWEKYPVLYFNMGFASSADSKEFPIKFAYAVSTAFSKANVPYDANLPPDVNFGKAIDMLDEQNDGKGVVILIDEYDDPVAQLIHKPDEAEAIRTEMAGFYRQMKDRTDRIRFLMITGVSKFTKMSVFSALSNLTDLTFSDEAAAMLGYTDEELDTFFSEHLHAHAEKMGLDYAAYRSELKRWFNGYRFGRTSQENVYNPVSIGNNLYSKNCYLRHFWTATGNVAMLLNLVKTENFLKVDLDRVSNVTEQDFDVTDIRDLKAIPMLYQTGYLTISDFNPYTGEYILRVPDEEVRQDLAQLMASVISRQDTSWVSRIGGHLLNADWPAFFEGLKALYAGLPYGATEGGVQEYSYERNLLVLLWAQGIQCQAEDRQANGQADIIATHHCGIYIFELKVDESADAALQQIKQKEYDAPYRAQDIPIWHIGLSFDRKTHHFLEGKAERA